MRRVLPLCVMALALSPFICLGDARHFTFLYEATTSAPGSIELENWATFGSGGPKGERFSQFDFRHEFEFGITNRLQASVYVADWSYQSGFADRTPGYVYAGSALEVIYNLTNPVIDPVGSAVYQEIKAGDRLMVSESKLIAQKNFRPLILAYNATLEAILQG